MDRIVMLVKIKLKVSVRKPAYLKYPRSNRFITIPMIKRSFFLSKNLPIKIPIT